VACVGCQLPRTFPGLQMDQASEGQGLDDQDTRAYVAQLVTRQLDWPGFTLHPDQVLLLSAR